MKPSAVRVLTVLHAAGPVGAPTGLLCRPEVGGARFGARVKELRDAGCVIENVRERQGSDRYWLSSLPDSLRGLLGPRSTVGPAAQPKGPLNPHTPHREGCPALAAGEPSSGRVPGVLGSSLCTCSPCGCDGCMQRAAGTALGDHQLAMQIPAATAAGAHSLPSRSVQLPVLGMVA